jgi:glycine dehydrogenase subunit 1
MALAATAYMAALGKQGMRKVAELNYHKAHYAAQQIEALADYTVLTDGPFFNEFVVATPSPVAELNAYLLNEHHVRMIGGYDLSQDYPEAEHQMLVAVTEMNSREEIDAFVTALEAFAGGDND